MSDLSSRRPRSLFAALALAAVLLIAVLAVLAPTAVAKPVEKSTVGRPDGPPPNIIFVVVDALRSDHISSYGYGRPTTTNLDAMVAAEGVRFDQATTNAAWTFPSNAALMSGRSPSSIGVDWVDPAASIPAGETLLAEYLHDAGYYTAGFAGAYYVQAGFGFGQGFDTYQELFGGGPNRTDAEDLNQMAIDWLDVNWGTISGTQPLFMFLYYFDPHTWYNAPPPYDSLYDPTYTGTLTAELYADAEAVVAGDIVPTERDIIHLKALYDGEITYWDNEFSNLLSYLNVIGVLDNSLIVVTSDHGQAFGEHGKWIHRNSVYEEVVRVPLLMRYSGVISPGLVITDPVQTMDVVPTILDWLSISAAPNVEGDSLAPLVNGIPFSTTRSLFTEQEGRTDPAAPDYWITPRYTQLGVRHGPWKYIHHVANGVDDELYRLEPFSVYEQDNIIDSMPATAEMLYQDLFDWFQFPTPRGYLPLLERP